MQLSRPEIQIIERTIRSAEGVFLAKFAVVNVGGTLKAKLVSMAPIYTFSKSVVLLDGPKTTEKIVFVEPLFQKIISPYQELFYLSSISPRAPNK